ncbi:MAG: hypothetical protein K5906_00620 [Bacilli bacterium]|nr:hypothetical protein [Bacilli bacterium]
MNSDKKKKVNVSSIVLYSICVILFLFAAYGIVIKLTNNSIYLFGVRSDAVLTDSMSYKNEDPIVQEFLKGHDDQLQIGDLTYSEKVTETTKLDVYDIVIFKNRDNGNETIHRIVEIRDGSDYIDKETRYLIRADAANHESFDGLYRRSEIIAKYKTKIPFVGHIKIFFSSIYGLILIVGLMIILLVYDFINTNYIKDKKNTENKNENKE